VERVRRLLFWYFYFILTFTGKSIGGPKFSYFISPNKTWAGFWGQFAGSGFAYLTYIGITLAFTLEAGWLQWSSWTSLLVFMFLVSLASIFGDLFESLYKRAGGTKDSNTTFNFTHGGALDKWDSLGYCLVIIHVWVANGWLY
jgi:phosphatidate cytidylyltransferase